MAANLDAAQIVRSRTRNLLLAVSHAPYTRTPSPPGAPPAAISGTLAASVQASHDGDDAIVGPTATASSYRGPYGRFLELGGEHVASSPAGMHWFEDGQWHRAFAIGKAPRPYLKPATDAAIADGSISRVYYDHWLRAQEEIA